MRIQNLEVSGVSDMAVVATTAATVGFATVAVVRPSLLSRDGSTPDTHYYAQMYAARAIPIAAAVLGTTRQKQASRAVLLVAAAAQLGDSVIGFSRRQTGQGVAPLLGASVYLVRALR